MPGEMVGEITRFDPPTSVTWEAPKARYRILGVPFTIEEGVTWSIEAAPASATGLSAHVWATFPGPFGWILQWTFTRLFHGLRKDRQHARTKLLYLKRAIEGS